MSDRRRHNTKSSGTRLAAIACAVVCVGFCLASPVAASTKQAAERLYETALEQVGRVTFEESVKAFRKVLKADRDHAPAHYEIAKLYLSLGTPMDRESAMKAVKEAILLDRDNVSYRLL